MIKGDIILIKFPFTDLTGSKLRPAVVLATTVLDVTVCFLTSQTIQKEITDILLLPTSHNGLRKESIIRTGKIATLDKSLATGLLGKLTKKEINELNTSLKLIFKLE